MSEKYPSNQFNLLGAFERAEEAEKLIKAAEEENKSKSKPINWEEREKPWEAIWVGNNPDELKKMLAEQKKLKTPKKPKLTPEQIAVRKQEELMRRQYDGR